MFVALADALHEKYAEAGEKQHFQSVNAISTYLWLRYPDKYYIYKYSECRIVAQELESDFKPNLRKGIPSFLGGFELYNEICAQLQADVELVEMLRAALTPDCYLIQN